MEQKRRAEVILVVDDDEDLVAVLAMSLTASGFSTLTATSVRNAVELLASEHIDALVTDLKLPDGTAADVLASSVSRPRVAIVLTGSERAEDVELTTAAGFDLHLVKPLALDVITNALRSRLGRPTTQTLRKAELPEQAREQRREAS